MAREGNGMGKGMEVIRRWCVVADSPPFCVSVFSRHWTHAGAKWRANEHRITSVMHIDEARRKDREYEEAIHNGTWRV